MTISEQIKILCVRCNLSEAELARRLEKLPQRAKIIFETILKTFAGIEYESMPASIKEQPMFTEEFEDSGLA